MYKNLIKRYKNLSEKLEQEWDDEIKRVEERLRKYEKQFRQSLLTKATKELDLMEDTMQKGDLVSAEYHKMMAESYLSFAE